jgi:hypothetical protein
MQSPLERPRIARSDTYPSTISSDPVPVRLDAYDVIKVAYGSCHKEKYDSVGLGLMRRENELSAGVANQNPTTKIIEATADMRPPVTPPR